MRSATRLAYAACAPLGPGARFEQLERREMTRRKYVVGNWKMNGLTDAIAEAQAA